MASALLAIASGIAAGQTQVATQDLWALDFANANIHVFTAGGQPLGAPIPLAGSGSARGMGFNEAGLAYVARGQDVRTYDGVTTSVFADVIDGVDQAQDVAVRPGMAQEVWIACGATSTNSKLIKLTSGGLVLATLTHPAVIHPRRIAWNTDGTKLFIASASNNRIFTLDPATGMFTQLADLSMLGLAPIGIAFDPTRNAVWTVGDYGTTGHIGFVDAMTGGFTTALMAGAYPGLASPSNLYFDRFRTLTVSARNVNLGVPGLYRFYAPSGSVLTDQGPVFGTIGSAIDVAFRPEVIGIGTPTMGNSFVLNASSSMAVANPITFSAPRVPNAAYAAALSPRWQTACVPYVPGILEPSLRLAAPDARGVPLSLSDGGFLVMQTAAICCFPATPAPINTILTISGFSGFLDASGNATAMVNFFPAPAVVGGVELSLVFITIDPSVPGGFGRISDPLCLTVNLSP